MQEDIQKSKQMVHEIIMKKYHPKEYAEEQTKKAQDLAEMLAFVEGCKIALAAQEEVKKALFVSDPSSHCGYRKQ